MNSEQSLPLPQAVSLRPAFQGLWSSLASGGDPTPWPQLVSSGPACAGAGTVRTRASPARSSGAPDGLPVRGSAAHRSSPQKPQVPQSHRCLIAARVPRSPGAACAQLGVCRSLARPTFPRAGGAAPPPALGRRPGICAQMRTPQGRGGRRDHPAPIKPPHSALGASSL